MHVCGQGPAFGGAGFIPVLQGQGQTFLQQGDDVFIQLFAGVAPQRGNLQQGVVVGREVLAARGGQGVQALQHGRGLQAVEARAGRGTGRVLQDQADVHPAARGKAPDHFFQARLQTAHGHGQAPLEVQVAAIDAFNLPLLGEVGVFHQTASESGHTAKHGFSCCKRYSGSVEQGPGECKKGPRVCEGLCTKQSHGLWSAASGKTAAAAAAAAAAGALTAAALPTVTVIYATTPSFSHLI